MRKLYKRYVALFKQKDKQKHLIVGAIIGLFFTLFVSFGTGVFMGLLAGVIKEYLDSKGYGYVEIEDIECTLYGSIAGGVLMLIIKYMIAWITI